MNTSSYIKTKDLHNNIFVHIYLWYIDFYCKNIIRTIFFEASKEKFLKLVLSKEAQWLIAIFEMETGIRINRSRDRLEYNLGKLYMKGNLARVWAFSMIKFNLRTLSPSPAVSNWILLLSC